MDNLKIGVKLIAGFIIVAIVAAVIGIFGVVNMKTLDDKDTYLYEKNAVPLAALVGIAMEFEIAIRELGDLIRETEPQKIEAAIANIEKTRAELGKSVEKYKSTLVNDAGKKLCEDLVNARKDIAGDIAELYSLVRAKKIAEAYALFDGRLSTHANVEEAVIDKMESMNTEDAKTTSDNNTKLANGSMTIMIIVLVIGVILAVFLGVWLSISITGPLSKGVNMMLEMAEGHLGTRLRMSRKDEIGVLAEAMDNFADDLQNNVVATVKKIGDGDLSVDLKPKDNQDEITPAIVNTTVALRGLIAEAGMLRKAAIDGKLATRGKADQFKGGYREIVQGVNDTLDAVVIPINEAQSVLERVAKRDMTARVEGDYKGDLAKIKDAINTATDNLDKAITQVAIATEQVSSGSQQISAGSQTLAQGANEQASSLEEVSSSLEEMSSMTKQNADNANQAKSLAGEANGKASVGTEAMKRMAQSINKIKESSDQTAKIVKTIDEIAMQTNLLALNAAVEAARAGEAGRGFAVVAEEVRNLAQRSAEAAKNTANMIEESVKNAEDGVKISVDVSKSFDEITTSVKKVNDLIAEIAAASQEQSQGIGQVNTAVAQMDKVTQSNAANSEESASAAEEMSSQAEELSGMIGQFQLSQTVQKRVSAKVAHAPVAAPAAAAHAGGLAHHLIAANDPKGGNGRRKSQQNLNPESVIPMKEKEDVLKEF